MNAPRQSKGPLSEINIIPLVDVMLVLLIIFMIAAPMMQQGLPINLPKVTTRPLPSKEDIQVLTVTKNEEIIVNTKRLELKDLKAVFFVLDFNGKPEHLDCHSTDTPMHGRTIEVTFQDGEKIVGRTEGFNPSRLGFFLFPFDLKANNIRIFVVTKNTRQVKFL